MADAIPATMRAHHFSSTSPTLEANLKFNPAAPLPLKAKSLAQNQALVRVLATSINPADYKFPSFPIVGRLLVPRPSAPGIDFAGRVTNSAPSAQLKQGALVFGRLQKPQQHGTLGEFVIASSDEVVPLPDGVSAEDAACVGTAGLIAYQSIVPHVKQGDNVFINGGSGGTGTFGIQIAKQMGCWVATTASAANIELCKQLGADEVIDYRKASVVDSLRQCGRKFQLVVDNVGADPKLWSGVEQYTTPGAPFVQIGLPISFASFWAVTKSKRTPREPSYH
jgi:NADPH:quinone reductase-like Zn-dependent oxidoreductase